MFNSNKGTFGNCIHQQQGIIPVFTTIAHVIRRNVIHPAAERVSCQSHKRFFFFCFVLLLLLLLLLLAAKHNISRPRAFCKTSS